MAPPIGDDAETARRRVFVLVDKDVARGVFSSWDAAETYADENRFSLDHLLEFQTNPDHPDHLHLMIARWAGVWKFVGLWSKTPPKWPLPPEKIRLDHYHALGTGFHLLRQKEFVWREEILDQINIMAPDAALQIDARIKSVPPKPSPAPQGKPKLEPLQSNDRGPTHPPTAQAVHAPHKEPVQAEESPVSAVDKDSPSPIPTEKVKPKLAYAPERENRAPQGPPAPALASNPATEIKPLAERPKISFTKKTRLRLKTDRQAPKPIPSFRPNPVVVVPEASQIPPAANSLPLSPVSSPDMEAVPVVEAPAEKVHRIWPMRLIVPVACLFIFWAIGIFLALKPERTTQSLLAEVTTLANARLLPIEPGHVFFQLEVDPVHQQRWVRSLGLNPIPFGQTYTFPQYHALLTWEKPDGFIRPPYGEVEVRDWWDLRLRKISYGFFLSWEDGSILILDLQSDMLLGWGKAHHFPNIMN